MNPTEGANTAEAASAVNLRTHLNTHLSTAAASNSSSLFGEILDWMLAPLLLLWPMSVAITWLVAKAIANQAFDTALELQLQNLHQQVQIIDNQYVLPANSLRSLSLADEIDQRFAQFNNSTANIAEGDLDLPTPLDEERKLDSSVQLRSITWRGVEMRVASIWLDNGAEQAPAILQIGETINQRARLANSIIRGIILPQFAILPIALFLVWLALARGLSPISLLQRKIRARQPDDLSPIANAEIPQEISPLVHSLNEMLERLDLAINQQKRFIADAAHQMKTPLAGMRMQVELALRDAAQNNVGEVQHSLQQLARSSENATHLVNQLLSLARAENHRQSAPAHTAVDLAALAKQVLQEWVIPALARQIDLGLEIPHEGNHKTPDAPATTLLVLGDALLLRELISNLLDNAVHYTPLQGTVTLRLYQRDLQIYLEVEDDGPGIAPAEREQVFERFYRILGNQAQGSGLGLAIVREIAQQHQANLSIQDHPNDSQRPGCLFRIGFPALLAIASKE